MVVLRADKARKEDTDKKIEDDVNVPVHPL
jgi:hypothetical protein